MFSFIRLLRRFVSQNFRFCFTHWFMDVQGVMTVVGGIRLVEFMNSGYQSFNYGAQRRIVP